MAKHSPTRGLAKSTFAALFWQYASMFSQALLRLLVLGILARLLTPEDFGLVGMAMIFVGFAALYSELGVGPAIVQRSNLRPEHMRVGLTLSVLIGFVVFAVLWISAPLIALFFRSEQLVAILRVVGLSFVIEGFSVVASALLKRDLQFKRFARIDVAAYVVGYACIGLLLAWWGFGVWALVGANLAQSLSRTVFLLLSERHPMKPLLARRELKELLYFGSGFTLARTFNYAATQGDNFVVGRVFGAGALGVYTRAYQLMMLPGKYFGQVLNTVLFPAMAKIQNEGQRLKRTYLTGIAVTSLVSSPLSALLVILAPEIVRVVLGPQWLDTIIPFQILSIGILSRVSYKMDDSLARALGAMYRRSVRDAIYAITVVVGTWIGLRWGLAGAAFGVLCAVVLNQILAVRMSVGLLSCSWTEPAKALVPGVLLAVIVTLVALPMRTVMHNHEVPSLVILISVILAAGLCLAGLFFFRPGIVGVYGISALGALFDSIPGRFSPKFMSRWLDAKVKKA